MTIKDIVAALKTFGDKLAGVEAKVTALEPKATNTKPISDEERAAFNAEIAGIKSTITLLQGDLQAATTAITEASAANTTLSGENATLKAELANKVKIATAGVAAAAELAAAQTVAPVGATSDVAANGKSPLENLQAQLAKEADPKVRGELAAKIRELKGISFAAVYEQANPKTR